MKTLAEIKAEQAALQRIARQPKPRKDHSGNAAVVRVLNALRGHIEKVEYNQGEIDGN